MRFSGTSGIIAGIIPPYDSVATQEKFGASMASQKKISYFNSEPSKRPETGLSGQ